jgi:hypothetical protein
VSVEYGCVHLKNSLRYPALPDLFDISAGYGLRPLLAKPVFIKIKAGTAFKNTALFKFSYEIAIIRAKKKDQVVAIPPNK